LLRIGAVACAAGRGKLDIKPAVVAPGCAFAASGCADLACIEDLFDLRLGRVFPVMTLKTVSISRATECPNQVSDMFSKQPKM
jgi:hypothetical protein